MTGTMAQADLVADLKAALHDAASIFTAAADADYLRHLAIAAGDMHRVRPRTLVGSVTVVANQNAYAAPADLVAVKVPIWGREARRQLQPWDPGWGGPLPRLTLVLEDGTRKLWLDPAPTGAQVTQFGAVYRFYYFAAHAIGEDAADTTVHPSDRHLLLLRAGAEAMLELSHRNAHKPVQLRGELAGVTKTATPAGLYDQMLRQFEHQAGMVA